MLTSSGLLIEMMTYASNLVDVHNTLQENKDIGRNITTIHVLYWNQMIMKRHAELTRTLVEAGDLEEVDDTHDMCAKALLKVLN